MIDNTMKSVLFLNLTAFSQTGGIERFNKCLLKALTELDDEGVTDSKSISAYDTVVVDQYYPAEKYKGFAGSKVSFILNAVAQARKYDIILLGHVNMAVVGVLIKKIYPAKQLILITHGIDVWRPLSGFKAKVLQLADKILSVSHFTRDKVLTLHNVPAEKVTVFPNTIDPFFPMPESVMRRDELRGRYGLEKTDFVIYTLTRLSATELFKGYDKVIAAVANIAREYKSVKYVIAGKYDAGEKQRIDALVSHYGVQEHVVLTGFLKEEELVAHYQMADLYIMPSKKEGFGIVFIEAIVCGVPVVAGNADGSVDALLGGETGLLVNPDSEAEIEQALRKSIEHNIRADEALLKARRARTLDSYSFDSYKQRLKTLVINC